MMIVPARHYITVCVIVPVIAYAHQQFRNIVQNAGVAQNAQMIGALQFECVHWFSVFRLR